MKDSAELAQDMSEADKVVFIESTVPYMSFSCRILKAIKRVTNQILLAFAVVIFGKYRDISMELILPEHYQCQMKRRYFMLK